MAWETALDRLLIQQIHRAEKGEVRIEEARQQVVAAWEIGEGRSQAAFLLGYGQGVLGGEFPQPGGGATTMRWYRFGLLRGHDRRGDREWIAAFLAEPEGLLELVGEPMIAGQCLPLVMRSLFWAGDLVQAVRLIEYLAAAAEGEGLDLLLDAAITDLLSRLEGRLENEDFESTVSLLQRCIEMPAFERLPQDVRARYYRELARRVLASSGFEESLEILARARELAESHPLLRSSIDTLSALATLRLHGIHETESRADRPDRADALKFLAHCDDPDTEATPDALYLRAVLAFETGDPTSCTACLERALPKMRRVQGRDTELIQSSRFYLAAALLNAGDPQEVSRALRLMEQALESVCPDLETFYPVHSVLKERDRKLALRFLDRVDVGRGTSPDQLLILALEYISLGEAAPASQAAERVLNIAVDLDQRIEALRVQLTAHNMCGGRAAARDTFGEIRELLMQRGAFEELENLLKNEEFVGQALDHLELKLELVALYEEMEDRDYDKAALQSAIARSLKARKDTESLQQAFGLLQEVAISFPDLACEDMAAIEKLLALGDGAPVAAGAGVTATAELSDSLGRAPRVLVVGGNERQRRHHPRLAALAASWGFQGEWLMANYSSPQKLVSDIGGRIEQGLDLLLLLHWNRHETTEPALELARRAGVPARTVHYAGFTSLEVCLADLMGKLREGARDGQGKGKGRGRKKSPSRG